MAAEPRRKPRYIIVEFEEQDSFDLVSTAEAAAIAAHEQDRSRGFAVVEIIRIIRSEHKTVVTRVK